MNWGFILYYIKRIIQRNRLTRGDSPAGVVRSEVRAALSLFYAQLVVGAKERQIDVLSQLGL